MRTFCFALLLIGSWAHAADEKALNCLEKFIKQYQLSHSYTTRLQKTEFEAGHPVTEHLQIRETNKSNIELKFLDEGQSGIRNNGMIVRYVPPHSAQVVFGKSHGFGSILNGLADMVTPTSFDLYDSRVVENQVFTVNRAGFGYLAQLLSRRLPELKSGDVGELSMTSESGCEMAFKHNARRVEHIQLHREDDLAKIEEKYGALAYLIYRQNQGQFSSFLELLNRRRDYEVNVGTSFTDFALKLDDEGRPLHMKMMWEDKPVGIYEFSETHFE